MLRNHGLSLGFLALFLAALAGQAISGHALYNDDEITHANLLHEQASTISFGRYVTSSSFGVDVMENWQSEYLQFTLYIVGTVWLLQRGSPESKELDQAGLESDEDQLVGDHATRDSPHVGARGRRAPTPVLELAAAGHGLDLARLLVRAVGHRLAAPTTPTSSSTRRLRCPGSATSATADFWNRTLQNWQSEFLAVGSMAVLRDLPAPARLAGVQAGRRVARGHRRLRLADRVAEEQVAAGLVQRQQLEVERRIERRAGEDRQRIRRRRQAWRAITRCSSSTRPAREQRWRTAAGRPRTATDATPCSARRRRSAGGEVGLAQVARRVAAHGGSSASGEGRHDHAVAGRGSSPIPAGTSSERVTRTRELLHRPVALDAHRLGADHHGVDAGAQRVEELVVGAVGDRRGAALDRGAAVGGGDHVERHERALRRAAARASRRRRPRR